MIQSRLTAYRRLLAVVVTVLLALAITPVHAQGQSLYWERFDVEIEVREDGSFRVTEHNYVNFTSGTFRFGFREIADDRTDDITDFEVVIDGRPLQQSSTEEPGTFYLYDGEDGQGIRYYFFSPTSGQHHIALSYTVIGGMRYYEGGDQLFWKAVYPDRPATIDQSIVTVTLPEGIALEDIVTAAYDTNAEIDVAPDGRLVTFIATEPITPGNELEIRVQFPHGIIAGEAPAWQERADMLDRTRTVVNVLAPAISLLVLVAGLLGTFMLWYTRGRDHAVALTADYLSEPPDDLPAGVVGTLLDERADMKDVMATLLDLAKRGAIRIKESEPASRVLLFTTSPKFTYELVDPSLAQNEAERVLIREFFGRSRTRDLEDLKEKFYTKIPKIEEALYKEVVERGWFSNNPNTTRKQYSGFGALLLFASIGIGICGMSVLSGVLQTPAVLCLPAAFAVVGAALIIAGQAMPKKTPAGSEEASRWEAFRRYLQEIDRYDDLEEKREIWDQYLPYAVAFGLDQGYIQKFTRVDAPTPVWYAPYGYGYGPHHYHSSGSGSGGSSGGGVRDSFGGSGQSGGGIQGASNTMALGLQSMSTGLASMLSTTASTLSSSPSSSGSGGGGGFSGGGGGGGGGGGSGGFG